MTEKRIYEEVIDACNYCPKHAGGWTETHCLACKPARVIKGQYLQGFPKWCPLKTVGE